MKGTDQSTEFKPPQQRAVRARVKNSPDGASSGETKELHPQECNHVADTKVNFGIQFGSVLEKSDEPQSESAPLHCTESAKEEKPDAHEHETDLVEILTEVKHANVTVETVELSNDFKRTPQDGSALECATSHRSSGAGLEQEGQNKASGPEAQTLQNTPCSTHLLDEDGVGILCGDAEKDKVERQVLKRKGVDTEGVECAGVDTLDENVCFDGETQSEATGETASVEPPLKRRLRRRMGMCGLGDRKKRILLEGQPCRKACTGEEGEEEEVGETDGENHDVLTNDTLEENSVTALMDNEATTEQMLLKQDAGILEDISEGFRKAELTGHYPHDIQDQLSVSVMTNDHDMETSACDNEPDLQRAGTSAGGWTTECSEKHEALSEEEKLQTGNEVTSVSDDVVKEAAEDPNEAPKQVGYVSVGVTEEMLKDSVKVIQEDQIGLEESEMEIGEQCLSVITHDISPSFNSGATDNQDPNVTVHTENEMALECMEHTFTVAPVSTNTAEERYPEKSGAGGQCEHTESQTTAVPESTGPDGGCRSSPEELGRPAAPPAGQEKHMYESMCLLGQDTCDPSLIFTVAEQPVHDLSVTSTELPQYSLVPLSICSVTDSQLNVFASNMELEDQPIPEGTGYQEDATELVCGLIRELSSLNRTVMAAHREMEQLHRGNRPAKPPSRRSYGPRHSEM
ncbi:uncharacterized protein LOC143490817 isoform X2 [Brachyhypopomus gauderio]